jgi:ABC-type multidrug transport system ATPase subunit
MNGVGADTWAIEFAGFSKSYRTGWTGGRMHAVRQLSLRLAPGQVLGILGPNGSGKSTLLKALAGLIAPTAGDCRVFGHPAGGAVARAKVGYLPETLQLAPRQTGREFLAYCAGLSGLSQPAVVARVEEALAWGGVNCPDQRLATLSKGMRQRIGLAQAILHDPPLILLDEPASGLDPAGRLAVSRLIRDLAARGKTVVFSSHLLPTVAELCDRLAILGRGRLLAEGTPAELLGTGPVMTPQPSRLERLYLERYSVHE